MDKEQSGKVIRFISPISVKWERIEQFVSVRCKSVVHALVIEYL